MPSAKLILVEDDPALAELLEFRFANEGYHVRVTADGCLLYTSPSPRD